MSPRKRKNAGGAAGGSTKKALVRRRSETSQGSRASSQESVPPSGSPIKSGEGFSPRRSRRISERQRFSQEDHGEGSQSESMQENSAEREEDPPVLVPENAEPQVDQEPQVASNDVEMTDQPERQEPEDPVEPPEPLEPEVGTSSKSIEPEPSAEPEIAEREAEKTTAREEETVVEMIENVGVIQEADSSTNAAENVQAQPDGPTEENNNAQEQPSETGSNVPDVPMTNNTPPKSPATEEFYEAVEEQKEAEKSPSPAQVTAESVAPSSSTAQQESHEDAPSTSIQEQPGLSQPFCGPVFGGGLASQDDIPLSQVPRNPANLSQPPVTDTLPSQETTSAGEPSIVGTDGDWQLVGRPASSGNSASQDASKVPFDSYQGSFPNDFVHPATTSMSDERLAESNKDMRDIASC